MARHDDNGANRIITTWACLKLGRPPRLPIFCGFWWPRLRLEPSKTLPLPHSWTLWITLLEEQVAQTKLANHRRCWLLLPTPSRAASLTQPWPFLGSPNLCRWPCPGMDCLQLGSGDSTMTWDFAVPCPRETARQDIICPALQHATASRCGLGVDYAWIIPEFCFCFTSWGRDEKWWNMAVRPWTFMKRSTSKHSSNMCCSAGLHLPSTSTIHSWTFLCGPNGGLMGLQRTMKLAGLRIVCSPSRSPT